MHHFFRKLAELYNVVDKLPDITAPTLVTVGEYDWFTPPRASRAIARGIPNAKMVEFVGAGHFPFSEEPEKFQAEVVAFLSDFIRN
jgi:proline iminopeptidase